MIYILLSVCCSVIVSVLLKLARRYHIDVYQAITWNYSVAIVLTWLIYRPATSSLREAPAYIYTSLGILLPLLFVVLAASVRFAGIVRSDIAQRLSLLISLGCSFLLFKEPLNALKLIGISIGLAAIVCLLTKPGQPNQNRRTKNPWLYLAVVFVGLGVIDVLFKQMAGIKGMSFTASLLVVYILSFVVSLIVMLVLVFNKSIRFQLRHIGFGWILGIANFGNILFFLKAHQNLSGSPTIVFSGMNIGVIALGAIIGLVVFKEHLSKTNKIGIALAVIAVVVLAFSQR